MKKGIIAMLLLTSMGLSACTPAVPTESEPTVPAPTNALNEVIPAAGKEIRSILLIGNSSCYYWCDELYAMAKAAGMELYVANLYISGCPIQTHVENLEQDLPYKQYIIHDKNGKRIETDNTTLKMALEERQWDAISLQQAYSTSVYTSVAIANVLTNKGAKQIYDFVKQQQPDAQLFWHQTWIAQARDLTGTDLNPQGWIDSAEKQNERHEIVRENAFQICHENQVSRVPVGDAWQIARADERIGDTLCNKNPAGETDYIHDGEAGGGQYLNACVWFEVLTQKSCIGNAFRPAYSLSEEKIVLLQQIAHAAVAEAYGADYAK